jgi:hypothetical protein
MIPAFCGFPRFSTTSEPRALRSSGTLCLLLLGAAQATLFASPASAQDDPETVIRAAYELLSIDPSRPIDRESLTGYFLDHAAVGFGTGLEDVVVIPVGDFLADFSRAIQAGEFGGVGQTIVIEEVECWPTGDAAECRVTYRITRPGEEGMLGRQTFFMRRPTGVWRIDSVFWTVDPAEGISLRPDVAVALQLVPIASRGFRRMPERTWDRVFPIWGEKLVQRGISFPLPFGVAALSTWKRMDVTWGDVVSESWTAQVKLDLWLLPFLNLYGIAGRLDGGQTQIPFSFLGSDLLELVGAGDLCEGLRPAEACFKTYAFNVRPPLSGWNFGFGMNPAFGYRQFIFTMPTTFTWTDLDAGRLVSSTYVSPRVGLTVPTERAGALTVFVGGAYLNADNFIDGSVTLDTDLPVDDGEIEIAYRVDSNNQDRWNYLVGFSWSLSKTWSIHAEADAGGTRQGATASLTFRY